MSKKVGVRFDTATPEIIYAAKRHIREHERKARAYATRGINKLFVKHMDKAKTIRLQIFNKYGILID